MLELDNRSNWAAGLYPGWNRDGQRQMTVVVKMAYRFAADGMLTELDSPPEIEEADRYYGDPGQSSLAAACESVPFKDGGEFLLTGTAQPPASGATVMEVSVDLCSGKDHFWQKTLRLFGPRSWEKSLLGIGVGKPGPLAELPLRYEYAYGGVDPNHEEQLYAPNPVGSGYSQKGWRVKGMALPQIEIGPKYITRPAQRVPPAGYGPLAPFWEPRLAASSQLDESAIAWGGCPFAGQAPSGLYNAAPLDQRFENNFAGGETIRLKGLLAEAIQPEGVLLQIPTPRLAVTLVSEKRVETLAATCDTLSVDTDTRTLCLVWRSGIELNIQDPRSEWIVVKDLELEASHREELPA